LALEKLAQVELESVEKNKSDDSRELFKNTNELLKKIGSNKQFIEHDKDIKKRFLEFILSLRQ